MFYLVNLGLLNSRPFWQNKAKFPNDLNGEKVWPPSPVPQDKVNDGYGPV
jgi:hypothetical protein